MATVMEYPAGSVQAESPPSRDDRYQAYSLAHAKSETIWFVQPDGSMDGFPYSRLGMLSFVPAVAWDGDGECVLSIVFDRKPAGTGELVVITGRDLFSFYASLGKHLARWVRASAEPQVDDGGPNVRSIAITQASPDAVRAVLDRRPRGETVETESKRADFVSTDPAIG